MNEMLSVRVAGDPDSEDVIYTSLSSSEIAEKATQAGTPVSDKTVSAFLDSVSIGFRKMVKTIAGGSSPDREQQFDLIGGHIEAYQATGNPVFSIDTKSKEFLGHLYLCIGPGGFARVSPSKRLTMTFRVGPMGW